MKELSSDSEFVLVLTTEKDFEHAEKLAKSLFDKRIVACISFLDIQSLYFWKGNIETSKEVQLLIKTSKNNLNNLLSLIRKKHSYNTPEILYWPVSSNNDYGGWMRSVLINN